MVERDQAPVDMSSDGLVATTMPDLFRLAMRQSPVATCLVRLPPALRSPLPAMPGVRP